MGQIYRIAGPTLQAFHESNCQRRIIIGPIRSGKSTACCYEVIIRAHQQEPDASGRRRTKFAVIRDTMGDLERTTLATWKMLFGQRYGIPVGRKAGIVHEIEHKLRDGTTIECEVIFFALDHPDDANKLLSLELTGAYINEARTTHYKLVQTLDDRVGQYPAAADGGCTWAGWWADTNPPDDMSWIYQLAEIKKPEGYEFFHQPGGIVLNDLGLWVPNPLAENTQNLNAGDNYYLKNLPGKEDDHIRVMYAGEYGFLVDGQRVIHEFNDKTHTSKHRFQYHVGLPIFVGVDGGKTPAAAFLQRLPDRRWQMVEELVAEKIGCDAFIRDMFKPKLEELRQAGHSLDDIHIGCDPAMSGEIDSDINLYRGAGITNIQPTWTNEWSVRRGALGVACSEMVNGKPRFMLSASCHKARLSLAKGYVLKKVGTENHGASKYQLQPDKNEHSHIGDAIMYAILEAGEGHDLFYRGEAEEWGEPALGTMA